MMALMTTKNMLRVLCGIKSMTTKAAQTDTGQACVHWWVWMTSFLSSRTRVMKRTALPFRPLM